MINTVRRRGFDMNFDYAPKYHEEAGFWYAEAGYEYDKEEYETEEEAKAKCDLLNSQRKIKNDQDIIIHKSCGSEINRIGEDGIDYCPDCEHICEGETEVVSSDEFDRRQL
jgi:hypothetical protein